MIGQKTSILSKLFSILSQKSQYDALFSYFSQKNYCYYVHILSKGQIAKTGSKDLAIEIENKGFKEVLST